MEFLSKSRIKYIQSLQHRKFRLKYDKFTVEGLKISMELIRDNPHVIDELYVSDVDAYDILQASVDKVRVVRIPEGDMARVSQMATPPGVLALCHLPATPSIPASLSGMRALYLDSIRDPGNLGTILRIADWFGLDQVFVSPECADLYNPKVLQAAMGSAFRVPVCPMDRERLLRVDDVLCYVCDAGGTDIRDMDPPGEGIFIFGNESQGVSEEIRQGIHNVVGITRDRSLGAESLNVSVAVAIISAWWTGAV